MQKNLFNILENKIQGKYYPNLQVVAAMNYGSNYNSEMEFNDDAFIRRTCVFKYEPLKKDVIEFFKTNDYQHFLQILINKPDVVYKHYALKDEDGFEFEQSTNLGSWHSWNQRLKQLFNYLIQTEKMDKTKKNDQGETVPTTFHDLTIDIVLADFIKCGKLFFNEFMIQIIQGHLTQIKALSSLDLEKEVLAVGAIPKDYLDKKEDVMLRLKDLLVKNPKMVGKYIKNIFKIYEGRSEFLIQLATDLGKVKNKETDEAFKKILDNADEDMIDKLINIVSQ